MKVALGIDVGGTSLRAALVGADGSVSRSLRRPLVEHGPEAVVEQIVAVALELDPGALDLPAAVGFAGQLWLATGVVAVAPNFGWFDVPFGAMLAARFRHRVRLVNDLDAITAGEAARGAGRGEREVVCVFVGTGVGMGVVTGGRVLEGADGLATELGHIKIASPVTGRLCGCGEHGCLEAYTSGRHLPALLAEKAADGVASPLLVEVAGDASKVNAARIEHAAQHGDAAAKALWSDIAVRLGLAIANAVTVFNPRVLILGGGVLQSAPSLEKLVVAHIHEAAARPALRELVIRDTELGDEAGVVGAGLLAFQAADG